MQPQIYYSEQVKITHLVCVRSCHCPVVRGPGILLDQLLRTLKLELVSRFDRITSNALTSRAVRFQLNSFDVLLVKR